MKVASPPPRDQQSTRRADESKSCFSLCGQDFSSLPALSRGNRRRDMLWVRNGRWMQLRYIFASHVGVNPEFEGFLCADEKPRHRSGFLAVSLPDADSSQISQSS